MADYGATGFQTTVSDSTPASGVPFTVNISGADEGALVTLAVTNDVTSMGSQGIYIAGAASHTQAASASGTLTWTVTITKAGTYRIVATNAAGKVVGTNHVAVSPVEAVAGAAAPAGKAGAAAPAGKAGAPAAPAAQAAPLAKAGAVAAPAARVAGQLAKTGFNAAGLAVGGVLLVLAGSGAALVARRRRSAKLPA